MEENDRPGFGILIPKIFLATKVSAQTSSGASFNSWSRIDLNS